MCQAQPHYDSLSHIIYIIGGQKISYYHIVIVEVGAAPLYVNQYYHTITVSHILLHVAGRSYKIMT